jgi:galactose oxidase
MFGKRFFSLFLLAQSATALPFVSIWVDSFNPGTNNNPQNAIDGNPSTFWHTEWTPVLAPLPHWAILDIGTPTTIDGFSYLPRQDGTSNGNIGQYSVETSLNNATWTEVASGLFIDDESLKEVGFPSRSARFIRVNATTEAGNRGPWTSAAEFNISITPTSTTLGEWGPMIPFPLVAAAGFVVANSGNIVTFSSYKTNAFGGANGYTITATYNPTTGVVSGEL